ATSVYQSLSGALAALNCLAVFAIQEVPHRTPARLIDGGGILAILRVQGVLRAVARLILTATWTTIGKPGLVGPEFELLFADDAGSKRNRHSHSMIRRPPY